MGINIDCAPDAPSWMREMSAALPVLLAENASASAATLPVGSRPAKRPRGRGFAHNSDPLASPLQEGQHESVYPSGSKRHPTATDGLKSARGENEADEEMHDRAVMHGESLADAETVNRFTALLDSMTERVDALADRNGGDLISARLECTCRVVYMKEILQSVQAYSQLSVVALVPETTLSLVIAALEARVRACGKTVTECRSPSSEDLVKLELGLLAATTIVSVLNSPDVSRALFVQDTLDAVLALLRNACVHIVYPMCDPLYHCPWSQAGDAEAGVASAESCGRASTAGNPRGVAKKRSEPIIRACCGVYDALAQLLRFESGFADSFVTQASSLAIASLGVDGIVPLQIAAGKVVEALLSSYSDQEWSILDGLREQLSKVPANRRSLRAFKVDGGTKQVRVASAVLVQALNVIGGRTKSKTQVTTASDTPDELRKRVMRLSFRLVDEMLGRTARDRDAEYRVALGTFISDVLDLFALPEWPGAEIVVQALGLRLVVMLNKGNGISVQTRVACLDMLGTLAARICGLYGDSALQVANGSADNISSSQELRQLVLGRRVTILSYLREQAKSDPSANFAQLFQCMQFVVDDADACEVSRKQQQAAQRVSSDEDVADLCSEDVSRLRREALEFGSRARTTLLQTLRCESVATRKEAVSSALYLSQRRTFSRQLHKIVDTIRDGLQQPEPTLRTKSIKMLSLIAEAQPAVLQNVPSLIAAIESSCMDVSKSVREASLDLLSRSVAALSGLGSVVDSDGAPQQSMSVYGTSFFERVFPVVQQRLFDSATSVRKRAIAIMHGVLVDAMAQLSNEAITSREVRLSLNRIIVRVCSTLADRLEDRETSVRESAERTLRLALFGFDPARIGETVNNVQEDKVALIYASRLVEVFLSNIRNSKASLSQRNVVAHVLHDAIVIKRRSLVSRIVNEVVALMCGAEARLADVLQSGGADGSIPAAAERAKQAQNAVNLYEKRLACTSVLEALAKVSPDLLSSHCHTLLSYLKGVADSKRRTRADLVNLTRVLSILEICVPVAGASFGGLDEVIRDVDKIVCVCPAPIIAQPAVKCFCALARCASDPELAALPADTARMFYDFLFLSRVELAAADANSASEAMRNAKQALPRLGLLARYGDFSADFAVDIFGILQHICSGMMREWMKKHPALEDTSNMHANVSPTSERKPFPLRLGVVRSLTYFLVRHRSFLPKATPLLVAALRQSGEVPDYEAQTTVLSGLQEMLLEEESRNLAASQKIGKDQKQAKPGAKRDVVLAAEEDVEAGYLALCAQAVAPELGNTAKSDNSDVRKSVVAVLGLLVRQGLVLPAKVVPALFGLLVDENGHCRDNSLLVVSFLADRYPGMLSSASMTGMRSTFQHAMLTRSGTALTNALEHVCYSAVDVKTGYSFLSPALILIQRDQRRSILCAISREFDPRAKCVPRDTSRESVTGEETDANDDTPLHFSGASNALDEHGKGGVVERKRSNGVDSSILPQDVDEGEVLVNNAMALDVCGTRPTLGHLAFYAFVLATMDYAGGSGVGGSLTVGGGTAAADAKLKAAREDVLELTNVISRIVSNSGQALLEAVSKILRSSEKASTQHASDVALHTIPICMLLLVKRYLKETRWFLTPPARDDDEAGSDAMIPLPPFQLTRISMYCPAVPDAGEAWTGNMAVESTESQLHLFQELMRDDLFDDVETPVSGTRRKPATSRRKRGVTSSRRAINKQSRTRASASRRGSRAVLATRARSGRAATQNTTTVGQYALEGDGDDDEDDDGNYSVRLAM